MIDETLNVAWIGADLSQEERSADEILTEIFPFFELNYLKWLPAEKDAAVLDFGFGSGGFLKFAESKGYTNLHGFEPDLRFSRFAAKHLKANIVEGTEPLNFLRDNENKYDFVICRQVAYYFPKAEISIWFQALAKTLRPGGKLIIEVFNGASFTATWILQKDPYIQLIFGEPLLRSLLNSAGLRTVFLGGDKLPDVGLKRRVWLVLQWFWARILKGIYFIERGFDNDNPTIFSKSLLVVAERPVV